MPRNETGSIAAEKAALRALMRRRRAELPSARVHNASRQVQQQLFTTLEWQTTLQMASRTPGGTVICCYLAAPKEIQTDVLIETARRAGCQICVPVFHEAMRCYRPAWLPAGCALIAGRNGIAEPRDPEWLADTVCVELVIVPGLAFDAAGGRVGHGGGHYDRFLRLPCLRNAVKAGLAFDFQIVEKVPVDVNDVRVDIVCAEANVYRARGEK